jgi:tetratricopeptide (TPR) repeat protein
MRLWKILKGIPYVVIVLVLLSLFTNVVAVDLREALPEPIKNISKLAFRMILTHWKVSFPALFVALFACWYLGRRMERTSARPEESLTVSRSDYRPNAEKYLKFITKSNIREYQIDNQQERLKLASSYYKINNNEEVLFRVICNHIDIPNVTILEKAKKQIDSLPPKAAFWIVGDGGTGKSSLLIRLAVEYAQNEKKVFYLNFENPSFDSGMVSELLSYIQNKTKDQKVFLFIDNPDNNHDALEELLHQAESLPCDIAIILTERDIRLKLMQKENVQYCIRGQEMIEPLKLVNQEPQRKIVYQQFYKLLGTESREIWGIIEKYGVLTNLAYVNSTYRILFELNKHNYIRYVFDWNEYENIVREKNCPSFLNGYRYIALFYLFGQDIPLSLIDKLCIPSEAEKRGFIASFQGEINEPIILTRREISPYDYQYFARTKHEVISELYFEEKKIDKNEPMAEIIKCFDVSNPHEVMFVFHIFGNKKNIYQKRLNFEKLLRLLFSDEIIPKIKKNPVAHQTLYLTKAWQFQSENDIINAQNTLTDALKLFPNDLHVRTELSKIYQKQDKLPEAEKILMELLKIEPKDLQARTELAKIYQKQNKLPEAEKILKELLDIDPRNLQARTELAKIYQKQNKLPEAEKILLECIKLSKRDLNSRTELAKIYRKQGKLPDAEKILLKCIELNPKDLDSRTELAKAYQEQNKLPEAERYLKEYIELDPKGLHPRTELAKIYQKQNKLPEAEKILLECINLNPRDLNSRTELAKVYQKQNKLPEAEKILLELLKLDPRNLQARTELAKVYQKQNKLPEAEKILKELLDIDPRNLQARTELAKVYQKQNKLPEAEKIPKELLDIDPRNLQARTELAKIYQKQNKLLEAEKILLELLKIDPRNLQARTELAKVYQKQNKLPEAEKILLELLKIEPKDLQARTELAKVYQKQNKLPEAEKILLESLEIDKRNIFAVAELICVYDKMGKVDDCFVRFDEFLNDIKLRPGRTPQAMFNNIFQLCSHHHRPEKAISYYKQYKSFLDERNLALFNRIFGSLQ